jgi:hypothetical protein
MNTEQIILAVAAGTLGGLLAWPCGRLASALEALWWTAAVSLAWQLGAQHTAPGLGLLGLCCFALRPWKASVPAALAVALGFGLGLAANRGLVPAADSAASAMGLVFLAQARPRPSLTETARWLVQCGVSQATALAYARSRERRGWFVMLCASVSLALAVRVAAQTERAESALMAGCVLIAMRVLSSWEISRAEQASSEPQSFRLATPAPRTTGPLAFEERPPDGSEHLFRE